MKPGRGSRTAVMVCSWRAVAHATSELKRFSDPTALPLLPPRAAARTRRLIADQGPHTLRERFSRPFLEKRVQMMVARTVAIDDAIRELDSPQLVILGAGLDGRAYRMPELASTVVFEVDHPDSQREKRDRVSGLSQRAKEVRFVAVDFAHDSLEQALQAAGHDPARPTTWIWEGVVMYLTTAQVESSLRVIAARSAPKSRLVVLYHSPAWILHVVGFLVRRLGEPLRSSFEPEAMRALLAKYGFVVFRDQDLSEIGDSLSREVGEATRMMRHTRIVTGDRP
ncbi:MAG: class I SAM-dependent methyltransferase [Myxococcales bacterium]